MNYTKPYSFNIVLNSQQVSASSSGNNNDRSYEFNWTNIPKGKYEMTFSYKGLNNSDFIADDSPQLFLSLSATPSTYQASNANGNVVSYFIGGVHAETHAANQVSFFANEQDNASVFFDNIPNSGPIRLQVFKADFETPFTTTTQNLANYVAVLHFKHVGKVEGYNI